jgi:hypothetical protein
MSSTADNLAELNSLRVAAGKPPLKRWSLSRAALVDAIDALRPKKAKGRTSWLADQCRDRGLDPKVQRAKLRRKVDNWHTLTENEIAQTLGW